MTTKLLTYLRAATPEERRQTAELVGTSVATLYQYAGQHREPSVSRAVAIADAARQMHKTNRRLPIVTVQDLAQRCEAPA